MVRVINMGLVHQGIITNDLFSAEELFGTFEDEETKEEEAIVRPKPTKILLTGVKPNKGLSVIH